MLAFLFVSPAGRTCLEAFYPVFCETLSVIGLFHVRITFTMRRV